MAKSQTIIKNQFKQKNAMNDVMTVIALLSKTSHDYTKKTIEMSGGEKWVKISLSNGIEFNFKKDGSIDYIYNNQSLK